jgi:hypothetical protein
MATIRFDVRFRTVRSGYPPKPGPLSAMTPLEGSQMASKLGYPIALPAITAPDLAIRRLTVRRDGQEETVEIKKDDKGVFPQIYEVDVEQDVDLSMSLVDIDDSGNESEPSNELRFRSVDETPPSKPGDLMVAGPPRIIPDSPDQPVPAPDQPVPAPDQPVPAPDQPVPAPDQPVPAPDQPVPAPDQPVPAPDQPVPAPDQPVPAPDQPVPAPDQPTPVTPDQPVPAPDQPVPAPDQPVPAPDQPVPAPDQPVPAPTPAPPVSPVPPVSPDAGPAVPTLPDDNVPMPDLPPSPDQPPQ